MDLALAVEHQSGFTLDFFKSYLETHAEGVCNAVMSPLSISTAMAMVGAGAKGNTLSEITSVLKLPQGDEMHAFASQIKTAMLKDGSDSGGPILSFANGVWVQNSLTLKPKFQELIKGSYGAEVRGADFANKANEERTSINSWILEETRGKIVDLLPVDSLNERTSLVLANALYFKGAWAKQFRAEDTKNEDFHLLNGETVSVPFLVSDKKQCVRKFDTHSILKLPYARGQDHRCFSMYFVLPLAKDGLPELVKTLDATTLNKHMAWTGREVELTKFLLPKFKVTTNFSVPKALNSLGMKAPFSKGADFTDMVEGPNAELLEISDVFHKCFVEVNEEGTEAAAATAVVMMLKSIAFDPPQEFVADHPFLFILREDVTGLVLFIGQIADPSLLSQ